MPDPSETDHDPDRTGSGSRPGSDLVRSGSWSFCFANKTRVGQELDLTRSDPGPDPEPDPGLDPDLGPDFDLEETSQRSSIRVFLT